MTATEELRRLLYECGVKYRAIGDATFWETHDGAFRYKAKSYAGKLMVMTCCSQKCTVMTPEQAIAATLGPGTCRMERDNAWSSDYEWHCTECGEHVSTCNEPPRFCPSCGRKVVDE